MVWLDAYLRASFKKSLQSLVPERLNHTTKLYSVAFHMSMKLMGSLLDRALPCWPLATLPKERGPAETVPGRKTETDRVPEGISEGFRPAESVGVAPRGREPDGRQGSAAFSEDSRWQNE